MPLPRLEPGTSGKSKEVPVLKIGDQVLIPLARTQSPFGRGSVYA
ncbi:hypothetical protein HanLR1_Chr10g0345211 [Helianthus annuus]|nr:hypothetical protein HanLR1_Chr10g0345211 [Helianthus annuus]